ncbi:MAG TPA: hypothetical protein VFH78_10030 [Candidatus Thermoplasmatota archaeon]|nr:hypothetical protein [Candidatus Thermoplasmatota archaeon]
MKLKRKTLIAACALALVALALTPTADALSILGCQITTRGPMCTG